MNIHQQIEADLKKALKSGDKEQTGILRLLLAAIKNYQIAKKAKDEQYLKDEDVIAVLRRQAKQRKDSISEYEKGGRADLSEKEKKELEAIARYLPAEIGEAQIQSLVRSKIGELGIADNAQFGKLMGAVMRELQGKADGDIVKKIVEQELAAKK